MKRLIICLASFVTAFLLGLYIGHRFHSDNQGEPLVAVTTDSVTVTDTTSVRKPAAHDNRLLGYAQVKVNGMAGNGITPVRFVPIGKVKVSDVDADLLEEDNDEAAEDEAEDDNSEPPNQSFLIPIEQKHYRDSVAGYEAWVSGYSVSLDSINLYNQLTTVHTTERIRMPAKQKRWGLSVGVGAVATPKRVEPGIFLGLTYTFLAF